MTAQVDAPYLNPIGEFRPVHAFGWAYLIVAAGMAERTPAPVTDRLVESMPVGEVWAGAYRYSR